MGGTITALIVQKRNKERVSVYLDGRFAFGLALSEAMKLRKGQYLSDEEIARLRAADEVEIAREHALRFLSYRPRSAAEVRRNLRQNKRQFSEETIEAVIARLERAGLIDDEAFARFWVENRARFGPRSARALRYELQRKGVPEAAIVAALADLDEEEAAYQAACQRAPRYARMDRRAFREHLGSYLARRGFSTHTIRDVLNRLWAELHDPPDTVGDSTRDLEGEA